MKGYGNEWWFNLSGFRDYVAGRSSSLTGAAVNIAAGLNRRIGWCALEGQDAIEPDDLDGYTNPGDTGVTAEGGISPRLTRRGSSGGWPTTRTPTASRSFRRTIPPTPPPTPPASTA